MRFVSYSLAAAGLSSLLLSLIVANAVLAPLPPKAKPAVDTAVELSDWSTTVTRF